MQYCYRKQSVRFVIFLQQEKVEKTAIARQIGITRQNMELSSSVDYEQFIGKSLRLLT